MRKPMIRLLESKMSRIEIQAPDPTRFISWKPQSFGYHFFRYWYALKLHNIPPKDGKIMRYLSFIPIKSGDITHVCLESPHVWRLKFPIAVDLSMLLLVTFSRSGNVAKRLRQRNWPARSEACPEQESARGLRFLNGTSKKHESFACLNKSV